MPATSVTKPVGLLLLLLVCISSRAVTAQSSTELDLSITKTEAIKLSNMDDWFMGAYSAVDINDRNIRFNDFVCVYSSTGLFSLTLNSYNGGNRLRLISDNGDVMRYQIIVRSRRGNRMRNTRIRDDATTISGNHGSATLNCSDSRPRNWNVRFRSVIGRNAFNQAAPGIYTDLVTINVSPE